LHLNFLQNKNNLCNIPKTEQLSAKYGKLFFV